MIELVLKREIKKTMASKQQINIELRNEISNGFTLPEGYIWIYLWKMVKRKEK